MTLRPYKGRSLNPGDRVFVYRNISDESWSVRSVSTGLVVAHCDEINLHGCEYRVSEKGRQRVLTTKQKNVHAGIVGNYYPLLPKDWLLGERVRYNPYEGPSFVSRNGPVKRTSFARLDDEGRVWA